jgi:quercetin dioxygenase-like cupin family protein
MDIRRKGSQKAAKGSAEYFTGEVRLEPLFAPQGSTRAMGVNVTFEPGARTAWHSHRLGQTLIITAGQGLIQRWDGPVEEIRPGDVVRIEPGEKHWHGAAPDRAMTHIAIMEQAGATEAELAEWMEKVSDEQYEGVPSRS